MANFEIFETATGNILNTIVASKEFMEALLENKPDQSFRRVDLEEMNLQFRTAVNVKRGELITAGTEIDVSDYGLIALQGRAEDQSTLQGLAFAAQLQISAGSSTPTQFLDRNNIEHTLTPPQVIELWSKGARFLSEIYAISWAIKEMDPETTDPNDLALWVIA